MESLLALPLGVGLEVVLFVLLYRFTPVSGKQGAVIVAFLALALTLPYSLLHWPGGDVLAMHIALYLVAAYVLAIISHSRERRLEAEGVDSGRWFHWGPAVIVLFFTAVILLNGLMVVLSKEGLPEALSHLLLPKQDTERDVSMAFPGTVSRDFQKKETLYNEYLEQVRRQQERGWQVRKGWLRAPVADETVPFQVSVRDRDDHPVSGARVVAQFLRPADKRLDQTVELQEQEPGLYRAPVRLPKPGLWDLTLVIERGEALHEVQASTRIAAAPQ
jgi:nitrogen fixation protein FixH